MKKRILIVEDSRTQAEALELLLAENGYEVVVAASGEEGIRHARSKEFDLILSDILLPGLNGYDLCRRIKDEPERFGSPPVVLLTSLGDPVYIIRGLESGADNYLVKPYEPGRLLERIGLILERRAVMTGENGGECVPITFLGERFEIGARREQILDFVLSSFEELIDTNQALQESQETLKQILAREQAARKAAEAATVARDVVLATVSHDLRNPLNTILMSANLILGSAQVARDPGISERVSVIEKVARQMTRLIQDLLDVATIEAGALAIERRPLDPAALAREGIEMLEPIAAMNGFRIDALIPDDLPPIYADRARILQVISNLLGNAIKFTPAGGEITLHVRCVDEEVVYSVADNGPGIPAEKLPRIFDRFWRDEAFEPSGAGLGLSIAKWVVEAHRGRIWVESDPGRGTTFHFSLPVASSVQQAHSEARR